MQWYTIEWVTMYQVVYDNRRRSKLYYLQPIRKVPQWSLPMQIEQSIEAYWYIDGFQYLYQAYSICIDAMAYNWVTRYVLWNILEYHMDENYTIYN